VLIILLDVLNESKNKTATELKHMIMLSCYIL